MVAHRIKTESIILSSHQEYLYPRNRTKLPKPELPAPITCKSCGRKNRRYSTKDNGHGKRYYNLVCSTCRGAERRRQLREIRATLPPEEVKRWQMIARAQQLKVKFKMTLDEYNSLLTSQKYGCAICGKKEEKIHLSVDHDHVTGKNRGILCANCNNGLGRFKDSSEFLRKAANYIDKWNNS